MHQWAGGLTRTAWHASFTAAHICCSTCVMQLQDDCVRASCSSRCPPSRTWRPSMTCRSCTTASAASGAVKVTNPNPRGRPVWRSRITTCRRGATQSFGALGQRGAGASRRTGGHPGLLTASTMDPYLEKCSRSFSAGRGKGCVRGERAGRLDGGPEQRLHALLPSVVSQLSPPRKSFAEGGLQEQRGDVRSCAPKEEHGRGPGGAYLGLLSPGDGGEDPLMMPRCRFNPQRGDGRVFKTAARVVRAQHSSTAGT